MSVIVRPERAQDIPAIRQVVDSAFKQDFESKLVEKIRQGPDYIPALAIVAEQEGHISGYILFSKIIVVGQKARHDVLALAPLAVDPAWQGKGIGTALVHYGLAQAQGTAYPAVIVLGEPSYYHRFGFSKASAWNIASPFEVPEESFMALELHKGALGPVTGKAVYPSAFTIM